MSPFSQTQVIVKNKTIEPLTSSSGGTSSFSPAAPPKNKWVTSKMYPSSNTLNDGNYFILLNKIRNLHAKSY
jgi:hypothetical protein